jgi:galactokinase
MKEFDRRFQSPARYLVHAPGRVNLIGEHTDYNAGFVLPLAIDRAVWIALTPRADQTVRVHSLDFGETAEFSLEGIKRGAKGWLEYLKGVAWCLQKDGFLLSGWQGVMAGDVPVGAGLSSSAALEMATARAFAAASSIPWQSEAMGKLCQRAENQWVGVNCGIMDPLISAIGRAEHALLIDCRSLEFQPVPFPPGTTVVVLDTATRRGLVDSAYNERRAQCEAAARFFGVPALRDVSLEMFDAAANRLDDRTRRRARHVVTENARTLEAAVAMRRCDAATLGRLMNESHVSLRDDFEVSSKELDAMVECGRQEASCLGIRMTGAGFGGCAVALVRAAAAQGFTSTVAERYQAATGHTPRVYVCRATNGATLLTVQETTLSDNPPGASP